MTDLIRKFSTGLKINLFDTKCEFFMCILCLKSVIMITFTRLTDALYTNIVNLLMNILVTKYVSDWSFTDT